MKKIITVSLLIATLLSCVLCFSSCAFQYHGLGYMDGDAGESFVRAKDYHKCFDTVEYRDAEKAKQALLGGEVEYLLVNRTFALELIEGSSELKMSTAALTSAADGDVVILARTESTAFDACANTEEALGILDGMKKGDFQIEWDLFYDKMVTHKGYEEVLTGLRTTMIIAVVGLLIGILIGTVIALIKMIPKYHVAPRILSAICDIYVGFFRGTPMVVQLLIGWFILLPALDARVENTVIAVIVFGMNSGAYVSEIMRSGIQAVDAGQLEAARAVGLGYWTSMMKIVIPQGIKNILPTLGNEFIILVKDTSIVSFIAVVDVTKAFRQIGDANYSYTIPYLMLALVYLVIVMLITLLVKLMERSLAKSERRK